MVLNVLVGIEGFLESFFFCFIFKVYWLLLMLGVLGCLVVMFFINVVVIVIVVVIVLVIFIWL